MIGSLVRITDAVEIDVVGMPAANLAVLSNTGGMSLAFQSYDGALWKPLAADNLLTTGTREFGTTGTGAWTAALKSGTQKVRVVIAVEAGGVAEVALSLPTPASDSLLSRAADLMSPSIVFAPGGVRQQGQVTTWADLMAFIASSPPGRKVLIDFTGSAGAIAVPAGVWNMNNAEIIGFPYNQLAATAALTIPDGAQLRNVARWGGTIYVKFGTDTIGVPSLAWDAPAAPATPSYRCIFDGYVVLTNIGSQPAILVTDATTFYFWNGASFIQTAGVLLPLIRVSPAVVCTLKFEGTQGTRASYPRLVQATDATSMLNVTSDGSAAMDTPSVSFPTFAIGKISYTNPRGPLLTTVDRNALNGGAGPTAVGGNWYMDKTVGKPGYYKGPGWVDGVGAAIP